LVDLTPMTAIIEINQLTKYYGKHRGIEDVNLSIAAGEIFGFLGPNGAGKTTTIRLLLHLLKPNAGTIRVFGKSLSQYYTELLSRIGNLPGDLSLYESLTGHDFLTFMHHLSGNEPVLQKELLEVFELNHTTLKKKIKYYSSGMKQKLGLVQAMQESPPLLILDEPTSGLDPLIQKVLYDKLRRFKNEGKTIFFSSHHLPEVEKLCDRVGLIRDGKLIAVEDIHALKAKMVRRMHIESEGALNPKSFLSDSIKLINHENNILDLQISGGDVTPLIRKLANVKIKNLVFPEANLEDIFLTYYE
jgi:ABC-2 type transport system ATP-binding protein